MRKYSKIINPELLSKFGLEKISIIVNNRARRILYADGHVDIVERWDSDSPDFNVYSGCIIKTEMTPRIEIHDSINSEQWVGIVINQLKLIPGDGQNIFLEENVVPVIKIEKDKVSTGFKRAGIGDGPKNSELCEFFTERLDELCLGPIDKRNVRFVHNALCKYGISASSTNYTDLNNRDVLMKLSNIIKNFDKLPIFQSDEIFKYVRLAFSDDFAGKRITDTTPTIDSIDKFMEFMNYPCEFKQVLDDIHYKGFINDWYYRHLSEDNSCFSDYPFGVKNLLIHSALAGDLNIQKINDFLNNYSPDMFKDFEMVDAFRRFLARDFRRGKIKDFKKFYECLKNSSIPFNPKMLNFRFMSSLINRKSMIQNGVSDGQMDAFEEFLEKDIFKALEYLNKSQEL